MNDGDFFKVHNLRYGAAIIDYPFTGPQNLVTPLLVTNTC
jgi:hypothetical protein